MGAGLGKKGAGLERGVASQTESLIKGFGEVLEPRLVQVFDARCVVSDGEVHIIY